MLGFFKYYNFFVDNLAALIAPLGLDARTLHLDLVLPVGISFYTFHMISYVVDVYHRRLHACRSWVDYALFVVSRFREERTRGRDKLDAIAVAGSTANRAVLFSGITVVLALVGMFLVPSTIFRSLAVGAILVVLVSVAAGLTLLPAVLSLLGDKVNWLHLPGRKERADHDREDGFWGRSTATVMRHPAIAIVASLYHGTISDSGSSHVQTATLECDLTTLGGAQPSIEVCLRHWPVGRPVHEQALALTVQDARELATVLTYLADLTIPPAQTGTDGE